MPKANSSGNLPATIKPKTEIIEVKVVEHEELKPPPSAGSASSNNSSKLSEKKSKSKKSSETVFAGTKGVPTYIIRNPATKEIQAAIVLENLESKAIGKIIGLFGELGLIINYESSLDAGAMFDERRMVDQPGLFEE